MKNKLFVFLMVALLLVSVAGYAKPYKKGPLQKVTFIHYEKGTHPVVGECGNGICEPSEKKHCPQDCQGGSEDPVPESNCYDFLANGAKWKTQEDYVVNPANGDDLSESFITIAISDAVAEWEKYAGDVIGEMSVDYDMEYDGDNWDDLNSYSFGSYPDSNVIAVATVWGYFTGRPSWREIVEYDILFNDQFVWGLGEDGDMDVQNIATHELGHGLGMADLYDTSCSLETMYGYSDYGETKKRDLNTGDITGLQELYG
jgi:hypothetical protein